LRAEIERLTNKKMKQERKIMNKNEESVAKAVWDLSDLLHRVDNDQELLRELLAIFKEDFPRTLQALESALAGGNWKHTASLSHTLKGMLANLGGTRAAAAAARLEEIASAGEMTLAREAMGALKSEAANLMPELDAYMTEVRR
jgi:two-component system, sensor histidine kinase and response regulator